MPLKDPEAHRLYCQAHYLSHRAEIKAYNKAHRAEQTVYHAKWVAEHPDRAKEIDKKSLRTWRQNNPDKVRAQTSRRYARRSGAIRTDLTPSQWNIIKESFHHCCAYCGKRCKRLTQDHITPLSKGGNHTLSNIVPACRSCNSKKYTGPPLVPVQPLLL